MKEISNFQQIASVRRYTITEGISKDLKIIDCNNGKIRFLLNESKALDVMQLYYKGENVSFISKNGFTAREIGFMKRFEGGMVYTVGLDSAGGREGFELHGTIHNNVATVTQCTCDENGITVCAEIRDAEIFGKNLVLKRRIYSAIGTGTLNITDTLVNEGYKQEDYCILYHINVGYPMLDIGGKIVGDIKEIEPRTPWAKEKQSEIYDITEPLDNQEETCYFLKLAKPEITLVNQKLARKFTVSYSDKTLPYMVEWKSMASGDYALGLEPCSTKLDDKFKYDKIEAKGEKVFNVSLSVSDL